MSIFGKVLCSYNNWRTTEEFRFLDLSVFTDANSVVLSCGLLGIGVICVFPKGRM